LITHRGFKTGFANKPNATPIANSASSVAGIWRYAIQEFYDQSVYPAMGGGPTGGYYIMEYHFNADGTFYFLDVALNSIHPDQDNPHRVSPESGSPSLENRTVAQFCPIMNRPFPTAQQHG
jgi:hypothetical protein